MPSKILRTLKLLLLPTLLFALSTVLSPPALAQTGADWLETPAEKVDYQEGGTLYEPLMDFVYELESRTELMSVVKLTETLLGRDVVLCVLSDPPVFRPEDVRYSGKPIVLIVNNVHGGEVAGKDASMELMRDLTLGDLRPLLEDQIVLVVPTINPDGAEIYRRTNEEGFDMNRDYIKLESQEIQALVTKVINEWQPHIHLDTHHGGSAPYTLTYQTNMNPAGDPNLMAFGNQEVLPRVREALRAEDYEGFWYSGPRTVNGREGWGPTSVEPRKQHVFSALANMVGFLYETPSGTHRVVDNGTRVVPIPEEERYRHQVRGEYLGQREILRFASERGDDLRAVVARARADAIQRGATVGDDDSIPLDYEQVEKFTDSFWREVEDPESGEEEYELVEGPVFTKWVPTETAPRPWGYLIPPSLTKVVPLLLQHDITVKRLTEPLEVEVETWYATNIRHDRYFQAHYLKEVEAHRKTETVSLPAGSFFIPSGQPMSNFISYIMEPVTNDNLVTWGYLDNVIQVTPPEEEVQARIRELRERLAELSPEIRQRYGSRLEAQIEVLEEGQPIPIHRLMHKTEMAGVLARPFNVFEARRYIR